MGERGKQAKALFEQGYNCAQAVVAAFADVLPLPAESVLSLISPFGGGMGRLREVCGSFSGILAVLGMLYGYNDPADYDSKKALYADVQQLAAQFREQNGSLICREMLGLPAGPFDPTPAPRTPEYYKRRPCGDTIARAADILQEYIDAHPRSI